MTGNSRTPILSVLILTLLLPAGFIQMASKSLAGGSPVPSEPYVLVPSSIKLPSTNPSTAPRGLLVLFHGEGGGEKEFAELFRNVAEKERLIVASFRGPVRMEDGGYAWFEKDSDLERDSGALQGSLVLALRRLKRVYNLAGTAVTAAGFSQGAVLALDLGLRFPGLFPGGVLCLSGKGYPAALDPGLLKRSADIGQRVFLIQGLKDDSGEGVKTAAMLSDGGIRCTLHEFNMGHALPPRFDRVIAMALKWLRG